MLQIVYLPGMNRFSNPSEVFRSRVFGAHNFTDVLKDAARNFIAPPALMAKSNLLQNHEAREYVDKFLTHCANFFGNLLQTCGHNRARQRDRLAYLFESFALLQEEVIRATLKT